MAFLFRFPYFNLKVGECNFTTMKDRRNDMNSFVNRMWRSAKLEPGLYEEVEADRTSMGQAMGVVIMSSIAAGIGTVTVSGGKGFVVGILAALIGWFFWAFITYFIGTRILPTAQTQADYGQLLRTIGFASSPGLLRIFGVIPGLGLIVIWVAGIWMLAAMVIAVRQALDYDSTARAIGVCLIGWLIQIILMALVFSIVGPAQTPIT
jgi:hypothetical protein